RSRLGAVEARRHDGLQGRQGPRGEPGHVGGRAAPGRDRRARPAGRRRAGVAGGGRPVTAPPGGTNRAHGCTATTGGPIGLPGRLWVVAPPCPRATTPENGALTPLSCLATTHNARSL